MGMAEHREWEWALRGGGMRMAVKAGNENELCEEGG
jgi:hypothetical protein